MPEREGIEDIRQLLDSLCLEGREMPVKNYPFDLTGATTRFWSGCSSNTVANDLYHDYAHYLLSAISDSTFTWCHAQTSSVIFFRAAVWDVMRKIWTVYRHLGYLLPIWFILSLLPLCTIAVYTCVYLHERLILRTFNGHTSFSSCNSGQCR